MNKTLSRLFDFFMITFGTLIVAIAVYFFMMPSNVSVGSMTGVAIVISHFVPFHVSTITMAFNVVLLILGFIFIGREFGGKTVYTSILLPALLGVLEWLFPDVSSIMGDPFLDMVCYIFIVSVGLAILFNRNASSGGLDIVAKFMNKFLRMEMGYAMSLVGMIAALSSALVYEPKLVILAVLGTYLNGIIVDRFIFGSTLKKRVCIISEKSEEIRQFLIHELHSGASIYETIGAFNMESRREIIAIVDKGEYLKLMTFIEKCDPNAFVTIYDVTKIIYRPKIWPGA